MAVPFPAKPVGRVGRWLAVAAASLALVACQNLGIGPRSKTPSPAAAVSGEVIGAGAAKVALLVPRSAGGGGAATATAFRNAADLALRDFPDAGVEIHVYDTAGTPAGAQAAIGAALRDGVGLVLGPVFSAEVAAIAPQARQAGVPVVAFSSDSAVAGPGVYLLSFLPSDDVERVVAYAASQGRKSFAAILPANAYGSVVEAAFRRAAAAAGGRIVAIETYQPNATDMQAKAAAIGRQASRIDALLIPDAAAAPALAAALAAGGVARDRVKFLGSGQWDDASILSSAALVGSWFPSPARQGFDAFSTKYQAAFGSPPPRNATLAYDGTVLAAGLRRKFGADGFGAAAITASSGFVGLDGLFRFRADGQSDRRLAVYELTGSGARIVAPAARSFAAGT